MSVIVPAILSENAEEYKTQIERDAAFAERLHIDVSDGEFAPTFTVSPVDVWWPAEHQADIHAMVARPSEHVQVLASRKPNLIIFHAEVSEDLLPIFQYLKPLGIKVGVALLRGTVPSSVTRYIEAADHVMIFSGELGQYGGTANLMQLEKVRLIRAIRQDLEVGWDGGVTVDNAFSLTQGGVDVLNAGASIARASDPKSIYDSLVGEVNKHGVI